MLFYDGERQESDEQMEREGKSEQEMLAQFKHTYIIQGETLKSCAYLALIQLSLAISFHIAASLYGNAARTISQHRLHIVSSAVA